MDDINSSSENCDTHHLLLLIYLFSWMGIPTSICGLFSGFVIGSSASLISFNFLAWKIRRLTDKLLLQKKRRVNIGFFTRAAVALLAVVISLRYEQCRTSGNCRWFILRANSSICSRYNIFTQKWK